MLPVLKAPFPWFGGKRRVAHLVWDEFGADVANYVEPFAGSLAVLLGRPGEPRIETVNDKDTYLANFWRAVSKDPEAVAVHADWPVNEADLHARHRWLVAQTGFRQRMRQDPDFFDPKVAGWWVYGLSMWIGSGWCAQPAWEEQADAGAVKTLGIHTAEYEKRPMLDKPGRGVHQKGARGESLANSANWEGRANAGRAARGLNQLSIRGTTTSEYAQRPALSGGQPLQTIRQRDISGASEWLKRPSFHRGRRGVQGRTWEQKPDLSGSRSAAGRGLHASGRVSSIVEWMLALQQRLRHVRVCCGDWERVMGPSVTDKIGTTAVFLDPPYSAEAGRDPSIYAEEDLDVAHRVREWAIKNGDNPKLRIALCGYEGEHEMPSTWRCVAWKSSGGYAASAGNHENAARERIWFNPACLGARQGGLFDRAGGIR